MIRDLSHHTIYRHPHFYAAFPAIAKGQGPAGAIVAFRRARDHRWLRGVDISPDDESFSEVDHVDARSHIVSMELDRWGFPLGPERILPMDPQAGDQDANLLRLKDGRLLQHGFLWYPLPTRYNDLISQPVAFAIRARAEVGQNFLAWGVYSRLSANDRDWEERRLMPPIPGALDVVPGTRPLHGGAARGQALELANGDLLLVSYYGHPQTLGRGSGYVYRSRDGGQSWQCEQRLALPEVEQVQCVEGALAPWPEGRLSVFFRTQGLDDFLVTQQADPLGRNWDAPVIHETRGHPHHPLVLSDGRLLLVYGYRHKPYGIRARLVPAGSTDYAAAPEMVLRDDILSPDLGYPGAVEMSDGRIIVVYYCCAENGIRGIEASTFYLS